MPKVSVVMPAYNAEKYIREAIDSVLAQTFTDFEFIILDDGSTDATAAIIQSYEDDRIRFCPNERNMGVAATLNRALKLAQGEYIARMDADDVSYKNRLEMQLDFIKKSGCDIDRRPGLRCQAGRSGKISALNGETK